jgi:hypothetical protein
MQLRRPVLAALFSSAFLIPACGEDEPPPPAPAPEAPKEEAGPAIDPEVKKRMDDAMAKSRESAKAAFELKQKGIEAERATRGTGRQMFKDAADKFSYAFNTMGTWCEGTGPEYLALSVEQRQHYIQPIANERQGWLQEAARVNQLLTLK